MGVEETLEDGEVHRHTSALADVGEEEEGRGEDEQLRPHEAQDGLEGLEET